jgi:hypothetical protein
VTTTTQSSFVRYPVGLISTGRVSLSIVTLSSDSEDNKGALSCNDSRSVNERVNFFSARVFSAGAFPRRLISSFPDRRALPHSDTYVSAGNVPLSRRYSVNT